MLIVAGLAAFISMLVAGVIHLLFAVIRRQKATTAVKVEVAAEASSRPTGREPEKAA